MNSKLTEMIGSGVDFARDLVGKSSTIIAIISYLSSSSSFVFHTH